MHVGTYRLFRAFDNADGVRHQRLLNHSNDQLPWPLLADKSNNVRSVLRESGECVREEVLVNGRSDTRWYIKRLSA